MFDHRVWKLYQLGLRPCGLQLSTHSRKNCYLHVLLTHAVLVSVEEAETIVRGASSCVIAAGDQHPGLFNAFSMCSLAMGMQENKVMACITNLLSSHSEWAEMTVGRKRG